MDGWVLWLVAAVALAVGEVLTTSFFLAPFALGALAAMAADLLGAGDAVSVAVLLVVSSLLLAFVRPVARRHLHTPAQLRTGTAALIGTSARVVERVSDDGGAVKLSGEVWTARPYEEGAVLETGTDVQVVQIQGATALVIER